MSLENYPLKGIPPPVSLAPPSSPDIPDSKDVPSSSCSPPLDEPLPPPSPLKRPLSASLHTPVEELHKRPRLEAPSLPSPTLPEIAVETPPLPLASPLRSSSPNPMHPEMLLYLSASSSLQAHPSRLADSRFCETVFLPLQRKTRGALAYALLAGLDRKMLLDLTLHLSLLLRTDILSRLPSELSTKVLSYLDYRSLLRALEVLRSWLSMVNTYDHVWHDLVLADALVSDEKTIQRELQNTETLVSRYCSVPHRFRHLPYLAPNKMRLLYKKFALIDRNWSNPNFEPRRILFQAHGEQVITCLQFDADRIVAGADDKLVNVFETETGKLLCTLEGHEGGVWGLKYVGNTLVTASTDKTLRVWDLRSQRCTHILTGHESTVRCMEIIEPVKVGVDERGHDIIFPKLPILVSGSRDNNLHLWDLSMVKDDPDMNAIYGLTYTQEEIDAAASPDGQPIRLDCDSSPYFLGKLCGHTSLVRSVLVYGKIVVSGSYDTTVRVWDVEKRELIHELRDHLSKVYTTAIDHRRNRVLAGSLDSNVNVWDLNLGELLYTLRDHMLLVGVIQLSDKFLATGAADTTVRIWDPETGKIQHVLEGHSGAITCFHHNRKRVVSGSTNLLVWDIQTGKLISSLLEDTTGAWQVRFNDKTCVAAVQKRREAWIEILDFENSGSRDLRIRQ